MFVTGTDTGVGKTVAACALVHAFAARGLNVAPMKPIAAGADLVNHRWGNADSRALLAAAGRDESWLDAVTPLLLLEPMAPHIAAAREGRTLGLEPVLAAVERLAASADVLVVEGVGGFRVPLAGDLDSVDLARAIGLPVVIVVGMRLGCLNHALLTAQAVEHAGLPLAGWIANTLDPFMAALDENIAALRERLPAPLLGCLPHMPDPDPQVLAMSLDVGLLG